MTQYQSFPDKPGDSQSIEKLKALRLPKLSGKTYLDVGCNEGFFCGYALFDGASIAIGIDQSDLFIDRAKQRFPSAHFIKQSWDTIPNGPFDVITLLSAIHYADDQEELIRKIMNQLAPNGTFILEIGIAPGNTTEFIKVQRGIDERLFPTFEKLSELLQEYAWKELGFSVNQAGDPVARHVIHITHKQPTAYLLLDPPAKGKSTIIRDIFRKSNLKILSADEIMRSIANGETPVSVGLFHLLQQDFSTSKIDEKINQLIKSNLFNEWIKLISNQSTNNSFAYDGYIPKSHHKTFITKLENLGYRTVEIKINANSSIYQDAKECEMCAEKYFEHLSAGKKSFTLNETIIPTGIVDLIQFNDNIIKLTGWTIDINELPLNNLFIRLINDKTDHYPKKIQQINRPDVSDHLSTKNSVLGFSFYVFTESIHPSIDLTNQIQVYGYDRSQQIIGPFAISKSVFDENLI